MARTSDRLARFTAVRSEGGLLPSDLLQRVAARDDDLPGLGDGHYHLGAGERLSEAISRSWNRLLGVWSSYRKEWDDLPESDLGTTLTRERWMFPLFQELGYGRLMTAPGFEIEGKRYPISHLWHHTPIHLLSARVDLDRRTPGVAGAATASPHGLVQEFLNRSEDHLWALISNGDTLRILRDNLSLTRQAYVEFDVKAIFDGELYPDFALLWLVCHESRMVADEREDCWLEQWSQESRDRGVRALDALRDGVEWAIEALGRGFLAHPKNQELRAAIRDGELDPREYYRVLLRAVYRLIFLFAAEDRNLLLLPEDQAPVGARERYQRFYSTGRLRVLADRRRGTRHSDLWEGFGVVVRALRTEGGCPPLALPALGGFLWTERAGEDWTLDNRSFLEAVRRLAFRQEEGVLRRVDYRNLGPEELGSVYESLLELEPEVEEGAARFELRTVQGSERKSTGSYYTPDSLIQRLLDSALEPVIREALRAPDPEEALLELKVLDPAVGSGHFLLSAAHRIAGRLAAVRSGEEEPSPLELQGALRDVISRCLFGVDLNPMAAELCKVSLWLESLEPGRPLSFLDHHIQVGNSLLGASPGLLEQGIPEDAFKPIEGDEKGWVNSLRKQNREERQGQTTLLPALAAEARAEYASVSGTLEQVERTDERTLSDVRGKEETFRSLQESPEYLHQRLVADAWCAAFVWPKRKGAPPAVTEATFRELQRDPDRVSEEVRREVRRLASQYKCFHFHVAYPQVFRVPEEGEEGSPSGWVGGFDVVLGNPPWERVKLQEKEWFAARSPEIADAPNAAARKRLIRKLKEEDPTLHETFQHAKREAEGISHFLRNSGRFPLCGRGDINTYTVFAETNRELVGSRGRAGCILPSGIATDYTTRFFFRDVMESRSLQSFWEFENEGFFGAGHGHMLRFALVTILGRDLPVVDADFLFQGKDISDLEDPDRHFTLSAKDILLINPNTGTCPIFRTRRDAEITKGIYRRVPVLVREGPPEENPWRVKFLRMFDMSNDSDLFRTREELEEEGWELEGSAFVRRGRRYVPLYEAKMIHQYDYRWATYEDGGFRDVTREEKADPEFGVMPRYWVPAEEVERRLDHKWEPTWMLGWRDVTDARASARTVIASLIPKVGAGNNLPLMLSARPTWTPLLASLLSSFALDFTGRLKLGGLHLNYFVMKQLPVLSPEKFDEQAPWDGGLSIGEWILEKTGGLYGMRQDVHAGLRLDPDVRETDREVRFKIRAELDAAFFHLYGFSRDEVEYVMETFPIVKRRDIARFGTHQTKNRILEEYDRLADLARATEAEAKPDKVATLDPRFVLIERPSEEERFRTVVPLRSLRPAAGAFGDQQLPEIEGWVTVPGHDGLSKHFFVAAVEGQSMEPKIPDGAYCLFRRPVLRPKAGAILLVELHGEEDPEHGGRYTIKRYRPETRGPGSDEGDDTLPVGVLESLNPEVPNIEVRRDEGSRMRPIAEFVRVVSSTPPIPKER